MTKRIKYGLHISKRLVIYTRKSTKRLHGWTHKNYVEIKEDLSWLMTALRTQI
jgi:hypothetical protein